MAVQIRAVVIERLEEMPRAAEFPEFIFMSPLTMAAAMSAGGVLKPYQRGQIDRSLRRSPAPAGTVS